MTQWLNEQDDCQETRKLCDFLGRCLEAFVEEFGYAASGPILEPAEKALYKWKHGKEDK